MVKSKNHGHRIRAVTRPSRSCGNCVVAASPMTRPGRSCYIMTHGSQPLDFDKVHGTDHPHRPPARSISPDSTNLLAIPPLQRFNAHGDSGMAERTLPGRFSPDHPTGRCSPPNSYRSDNKVSIKNEGCDSDNHFCRPYAHHRLCGILWHDDWYLRGLGRSDTKPIRLVHGSV